MIRDATLNLKYDNTFQQHVDDLRKAAWHGASIIGLQEVQTRDVKDAVNHFVRTHPRWAVVGMQTEVPIMYRTDVVHPIPGSFRQILTAHSEAYVNPERYITVITFSASTGDEFVYANTHVEQQFTEEFFHDPKFQVREIRAKQGIDAMRALVESTDGILRIGGDFNISLIDKRKPWYPFTLENRLHFDTQLGEDHIGWSPQVTLRNARSLRCNSDHRLRLVDVSFR